jgi:Protein of unknown function (DUF1629)
MQRPTFYRMYTDPYFGLKSHHSLDIHMPHFGNRAGPHPAHHLSGLGITLTSLGSGFPRTEKRAWCVYEYDSRLPLRDFESMASTWIISNAAKAVLEHHAKDAIDTIPIDVSVRYKGEDRPAGERWLCDVIRFEDAVDESASAINWYVDFPRYGVNSKFAFKADLPLDLHLFRLWKDPDVIACSQVLRDAIKAEQLTGIVLDKF